MRSYSDRKFNDHEAEVAISDTGPASGIALGFLAKSLATCALNRSHSHFFFDAVVETHEHFVF